MTADLLDRRCLGALQPVDAATGTPVGRRLALSGANLRLVPTASGLYAITFARGFEQYVDAFDPVPSTPAPGTRSFRVDVWDPLGLFLPRALTIALPRATTPGADSVFEPIRIPMYRAPRASLSTNWGAVYGSILPGPDGKVPAAQIRVVRESNGEVLGTGLNVTFSRDEAAAAVLSLPPELQRETLRNLPSARTVGDFCVPIVGLPLSSWSEEPPLEEGEDPEVHDVFASDVSVRLHFHPVVGETVPVDPGNPTGPAPSENRSPVISVAPGRHVDAGAFELVVQS